MMWRKSDRHTTGAPAVPKPAKHGGVAFGDGEAIILLDRKGHSVGMRIKLPRETGQAILDSHGAWVESNLGGELRFTLSLSLARKRTLRWPLPNKTAFCTRGVLVPSLHPLSSWRLLGR